MAGHGAGKAGPDIRNNGRPLRLAVEMREMARELARIRLRSEYPDGDEDRVKHALLHIPYPSVSLRTTG